VECLDCARRCGVGVVVVVVVDPDFDSDDVVVVEVALLESDSGVNVESMLK